MDLCLYARDHGVSPAEAAPVLGLSIGQVERAYGMIDSKRVMAKYLHAPPAFVVDDGPDAEVLSTAYAMTAGSAGR
jgi:NAD+ synthase